MERKVRIGHQRCDRCGCSWTLGEENFNWQPCPGCGAPSGSNVVKCMTKEVYVSDASQSSSAISTVGSSPSYSSSGGQFDPEYTKAGLTMAGIALLVAPALFLAFLPGSLLMMLFKWGKAYDSAWVFWLCSIGLSGLAFILCGADWKKYVGLIGVLAVVMALLAWIITPFAPFTYIWHNMFG